MQTALKNCLSKNFDGGTIYLVFFCLLMITVFEPFLKKLSSFSYMVFIILSITGLRSTEVYRDTQSKVTISKLLVSNFGIFKIFSLKSLVEFNENLHFLTIGAIRLCKYCSPPTVILFMLDTMGLSGIPGL